VRCYEEIEYVVDILKMLFLVALILSNIIINL
jgi:amino acid permease